MRMMMDMMMMGTNVRTAANNATWENRAAPGRRVASENTFNPRLHLNISFMFYILLTPTAGHQFDVPPVNESILVGSLTADSDVLRFKEGHLAPDLVGPTPLGDVGVDAQQLRISFQRLPQGRLVAAPAGVGWVVGGGGASRCSRLE